MRNRGILRFALVPVSCLAIVAFATVSLPASATEKQGPPVSKSSRIVSGNKRPDVAVGRFPQLPPLPPEAPPTKGRVQLQFVRPGQLPPSANTALIEPATCSAGAQAWGIPVVCGYVPVPLDWKHPDKSEKIKIFFELYTPDRPGPAESAMLMNWGGPGSTTTGYRFYALYFFGSNLDAHDLLLIDDRGRGYSNTVDCGPLQHGTEPFAQAEADCATQLGMAASRYGTGDIAQDMDAVRAALGYDKVDYFGWSYGGADVEAYATRFGDHLRSIVLDSPVGTPGIFEFDFDRARTHSEPRMIRLDCLRSPTCAPDHPFPNTELDALIEAIRDHPVEGDAYDASGNPIHVKIDEGTLLGYIIDNPTGNFVSTGELLAAGRALMRGDTVPLLRLGAEMHYPLELADSGDPTAFSYGAMLATWSADFQFPWSWGAPVSTRQKQFDSAVAKLSRWFFEPFSKTAVTRNLLFDMVWPEIWWELPTKPSPIALPNARYAHVPTLVLSGDMDRRVPFEITTKVASLYPDSVFVPVAEAGHVAIIWSTCAANLASEFIRTLNVGDTTCAATPETVWPAVGRFPLLARDAVPAEETAGNQINEDERKVVTVAVAAATDAMQRMYFGSGDGVGLRGGTFHTDYDDLAPIIVTLTNSAFAGDVAVSGVATWFPGSPAVLGAGGDSSFTADLTVTGAGTAGGTLHVEGKWQAPGPVGRFSVTGTLGGKNVAVLVPEA